MESSKSATKLRSQKAVSQSRLIGKSPGSEKAAAVVAARIAENQSSGVSDK